LHFSPDEELVRVFRTTAKEAAARTSGFRVLDSQSHIQGVVIPGNAAVLKAAEMLKVQPAPQI
jgi:hypothetical protein